MNKTAIKNFAIWARRKLIADITYKAGMLGVTEKGIAEPLAQSTKDLQFFDIGTKEYAQVAGEQIKQRIALIHTIREREKTSDYKTAFQSVVEEIAYTWFNRLIAIRFMEVNDYLPSHIRVLSSENSDKLEPDIVTAPFETDLEFTPYETDLVYQMKDENRLDELFRTLFIKQCNKLGEILPELFEKIADYTELLLTISFTDKDGVVYHLTHDISEDDFNVEKEGQVEIIGWMYQYYNTEPKDEVFKQLKNNKKITKEKIPAATQLFTPDWIVRYMVENSLGRLWVEGHPNEELKANWKYYLEEAKQEEEVQKQLDEIRKEYAELNPVDIKCIDPCMGSGHILVYMFDVLMQIYETQGYTQREAAKSILSNNIYGIDIDKRAYQLAYFAVMMKARQYSRRILEEGILPNLIYVQGSPKVSRNILRHLDKYEKLGNQLLDDFKDAEEYGSILKVVYSKEEVDGIEKKVGELEGTILNHNMLIQMELKELIPAIKMLIRQARIMGQKYDVCSTNPPYMGASNMNPKLSEFIKTEYQDYKSDFFSAFIVKATEITKKTGFLGFLTPYVWMFIQSYEKMRVYLYDNACIETLIQFEYSAFEEATVPICTFALRNQNIPDKKGCYLRLTEFRGGMEVQRQKALEAINNPACGFYYEQCEENFSKIPGSPVAYWVGESVFSVFRDDFISNYSISNGQNITGDNNKYLRLFWEVDKGKIRNDYWAKCARGGGYRKFHGNDDNVILWTQEAKKHYHTDKIARIIPEGLQFRPGITWSYITSSLPSFRKLWENELFEKAGTSIFVNKVEFVNPLLGLLNSKVTLVLLKIINPTINYQVRDIFSIPVKKEVFNDRVSNLVEENVLITKKDWDSFETSWDFEEHPFVRLSRCLWDVTAIGASVYSYYGKQAQIDSPIELCYKLWAGECNERFKDLKNNEEELNRIIIEIYELQEEITPEVEDKDVSIRKADVQRDIKSLISYAVGCMFGRYSLDVEGLAYAGGEWDGNKYKTFIPDEDNCIPITDEEYFEDDIVGRFVEFIRVVYGEETLEENLDFIASALGNKGETSRKVIRNYFLNDFYKDHLKVYQKRPIYWLFDSGKQNGFKALVYMHRWNADTVGNVRIEYLHKMQKVYDHEMELCQDIIDNSQDNREIKKASDRKEKLLRQQKECKDYDAKIAHIALNRINIDLDDGVKRNYRKVQTGADGTFCEILAESKAIMAKEEE